ncbi:MAG: hypothetical protein ACRERE_03855 [Candidatus Entotheonellia bacterium]
MGRIYLRTISGFSRGQGGCALWGLILALMLGVSSVGAKTPAPKPPAEVNGEVIAAEELERALGA